MASASTMEPATEASPAMVDRQLLADMGFYRNENHPTETWQFDNIFSDYWVYFDPPPDLKATSSCSINGDTATRAQFFAAFWKSLEWQLREDRIETARREGGYD